MPCVQKRYEDAAKNNFRYLKRSLISLLKFYLNQFYNGVILLLFFQRIVFLFTFYSKKYQFTQKDTSNFKEGLRPCEKCKEMSLNTQEKTNKGTNKGINKCTQCQNHTCKAHMIILCENCFDVETN